MNALAPRTHRFRTLRLWTLIGSSGLCCLATACGEDDPTIITAGGGSGTGGSGTGGSGTAGSGTAGSGTGGSTATAGSSGTGGSPTGGTGGTGSPVGGNVDVSGEITANTTWTSENTYRLQSIVYVVNDSTLTIEAGTTILGAIPDSALVVTRGSRLVAEGTADAPIVFTSGVATGIRDAGDWAGVVLLGSASTNVRAVLADNMPGDPIDAQIEGIPATENRGAFGGTDDEHDCGSLRYVRIEFAGRIIGSDNELNGLTLGGCGRQTTLDYIQVHRGLDDGIEFFGGTADLKHAVLSNNDDDSLDWDLGWVGRGQFIVVRHHESKSDSAFEADNTPGPPDAANFDLLPRSNPVLYNLTLVGTAGSGSPGIVMRRGTWGTIRNAIVTGFPAGGFDLRDAQSAAGVTATPPALLLENSLFFENGTDGTEHGDNELVGTTVAPTNDDDAGFDEAAFLSDVAHANKFEAPLLGDPGNLTEPNFVPGAGSPAASGAATVPADGFFDAVTYIGALPVGGPDWTANWTSYPAN
jgi:hypothetical protein